MRAPAGLVLVAVVLLASACGSRSGRGGAEGTGGASGRTPGDEAACPPDPASATGTACAPEGRTCGTSTGGFTHFLMCSGGRWTEMEAPPPPPPPPPPAP